MTDRRPHVGRMIPNPRRLLCQGRTVAQGQNISPHLKLQRSLPTGPGAQAVQTAAGPLLMNNFKLSTTRDPSLLAMARDQCTIHHSPSEKTGSGGSPGFLSTLGMKRKSTCKVASPVTVKVAPREVALSMSSSFMRPTSQMDDKENTGSTAIITALEAISHKRTHKEDEGSVKRLRTSSASKLAAIYNYGFSSLSNGIDMPSATQHSSIHDSDLRSLSHVSACGTVPLNGERPTMTFTQQGHRLVSVSSLQGSPLDTVSPLQVIQHDTVVFPVQNQRPVSGKHTSNNEIFSSLSSSRILIERSRKREKSSGSETTRNGSHCSEGPNVQEQDDVANTSFDEPSTTTETFTDKTANESEESAKSRTSTPLSRKSSVTVGSEHSSDSKDCHLLSLLNKVTHSSSSSSMTPTAKPLKLSPTIIHHLKDVQEDQKKDQKQLKKLLAAFRPRNTKEAVEKTDSTATIPTNVSSADGSSATVTVPTKAVTSTTSSLLITTTGGLPVTSFISKTTSELSKNIPTVPATQSSVVYQTTSEESKQEIGDGNAVKPAVAAVSASTAFPVVTFTSSPGNALIVASDTVSVSTADSLPSAVSNKANDVLPFTPNVSGIPSIGTSTSVSLMQPTTVTSVQSSVPATDVLTTALAQPVNTCGESPVSQSLNPEVTVPATTSFTTGTTQISTEIETRVTSADFFKSPFISSSASSIQSVFSVPSDTAHTTFSIPSASASNAAPPSSTTATAGVHDVVTTANSSMGSGFNAGNERVSTAARSGFSFSTPVTAAASSGFSFQPVNPMFTSHSTPPTSAPGTNLFPFSSVAKTNASSGFQFPAFSTSTPAGNTGFSFDSRGADTSKDGFQLAAGIKPTGSEFTFGPPPITNTQTVAAFGSSNTTTTPAPGVGSGGGGIFGSSSQTKPNFAFGFGTTFSNTGSVFGSSASTMTSAPSVLGTGVTPVATSKSFFGTSTVPVTASTTSVFGTITASTTTSASTFGSNTVSTTSTGSLFGSVPTSAASVFGSVTTSTTSAAAVFSPSRATTSAQSIVGSGTAVTGSGSVLGMGTTAASNTGSVFGSGKSSTPGTFAFGASGVTQTNDQQAGNLAFGATPLGSQQSNQGFNFTPAKPVSGQQNGGLTFSATQFPASQQSSGIFTFGASQPNVGFQLGATQPVANGKPGGFSFNATQPSSSQQPSGGPNFGTTQPFSGQQPSGVVKFGATQPFSGQQTSGGVSFGATPSFSAQQPGGGVNFGTPQPPAMFQQNQMQPQGGFSGSPVPNVFQFTGKSGGTSVPGGITPIPSFGSPASTPQIFNIGTSTTTSSRPRTTGRGRRRK